MLVALAVIGGCDASGDQASAESVTKAFMEALQKEDADKLAELTGEDRDEFYFDEEESIQSYEILSVEETSDTSGTSTVKVTEEWLDEEESFTFDYILELTKRDGKWFVTDLDLDFDWDDIMDWDEDWDEEWDEEFDFDEEDFDLDF